MTKFSSGTDWTFSDIERAHDHIEQIARDLFGLEVYRPQIEIIHSEQMLDAYCSSGMPISYPHWSYGKAFVREHTNYRQGRMGLAYEIVINSNPCIAYLMEDNTMAMQCLVIAHACYGHNAFFRNNEQFKQWTDADTVIEYLAYAREFVLECEEKYGVEAVERILDAAHALSMNSIDRYKRPADKTKAAVEQAKRERRDYEHAQFNDLWRTIPPSEGVGVGGSDGYSTAIDPEENLLFFIETYSELLDPWQRELLNIVRRMSQYFYPQMQTKIMNEGFATFVHYHIVNEMHNRGLVDDGFMLEFLASHTAVVRQPSYARINPYALGFSMFQDIKRICEQPTAEDREWFPTMAGSGDWVSAVKFAAYNFKDESFIQQYLSPKVIRDMKLFSINDDSKNPSYVKVTHIHDDVGYRNVRDILAHQTNVNNAIPCIEVVDYRKRTDRAVSLRHISYDGRTLHTSSALQTLDKFKQLWGYDATLCTVAHDDGRLLKRYQTVD